ncbi:hypothetical protein BDV93DRAFT_519115 [Ceratobasidium sp. AG-I]|nr:hypothetical protein BDV93DRAFT_519115 [Ceratobasidium sp. AG-I]
MRLDAPTSVLPGSSNDLSTMDYLDAYYHDTVFMHNTLIRAFNGITSQALRIQPFEIPPFSTYVDAFCETLRRHCEGENSTIFPRLASYVPLTGADNLAVLEALERVEEWVREAVRVPEKVDLAELLAAMEAMAPRFTASTHDQVKFMSPSTLRPCIAGPELRGLVNDDIAWIAQNSKMEYLIPFLVLHHDRTTNAFWPGLPEEVKSVIPALIETHAAAWVYAPFDLSGQPQAH